MMDSKKPALLVIGSANTDHVVISGKLPLPGETVSGGHYKQAFGGKGANQAVAAARAGAVVSLVACLGSDSAGLVYLENLKRNGIETRYIRQTEDAASGIALIMVDEKGENCISVAPGANQKLAFSDVEPVLKKEEFDLALLQMEIPADTLKASIDALFLTGIPCMLNMAPFAPLDDETLKKVDILVLNELEAAGLSGIQGESPETVAKSLFHRLHVKTILLTLGSAGVLLCENGVISLHPSFEVKVIDSTAAGDTFCGYFAFAVLSGMSREASIRFAQAASAICVGREGAQPSIPQAGEVKAFLLSRN
jgi:ribokinase